MSGNEIRERIEMNNSEISRMFDEIEVFKLNARISSLMAENKALQRECGKTTGHSFDENGICRFCGVSK